MNLAIQSPVMETERLKSEKIAVIGLGYVGFPLAISLAKKYVGVVGFDVNEKRVATLRAGTDWTNEIESEEIERSDIGVTGDQADLADATAYLVTVPTPVDKSKRPDLEPVRSACRLVGQYLKKGDLVVFESTVFPGVTEDICGPILEEISGLKASKDFWLGYSPERINPGDKENTIEKVIKVVSGDTPATCDRVAAIYETIIEPGVYRAETIKVAEAAKVIENTQRDVNIALVNELAKICQLMDIRTVDVINAAASKWNFLPYKPGLVGGHCIGVDPYYLTARAEEFGYHPEVILAGRRINDSMSDYVVQHAVRLLARQPGSIRGARVGVFGVAFKENVPDIRNSKVIDLIEEMRDYGLDPVVHDPYVGADVAAHYGITLVDGKEMTGLDLAILTTPHKDYTEDTAFLSRIKPDGILMDVKSAMIRTKLPQTMTYWCL